MNPPLKTFGFVHYYEVSKNYVSFGWFGRDMTPDEKKTVIKEYAESMMTRPEGIQSTVGLGILPPLPDASAKNKLQ